MPYNENLADRLREYLAEIPNIEVEEKKMFRGLAFLVNDKMCVNVSGDNLMCRFDPDMEEEMKEKPGFESVKMAGRYMKGYGYINEDGYRSPDDFKFWVDLALDFNPRAKSSKKTKTKKSR
ncbi:MAG: RNA methyltransferase [Flammeovirgaceae bacterium]|nr:RNA methyltransferase [Flammeovirgaceae bacterium]MBE63162.1 RNA methyltransferase [Flammeovirgaceae bacterium]HCX23307.1 RNA methyltransferase [Cytophagales bacterium]|tara:strand:- start:54 stop:416 length:363 start_codon:yes stop_codon:yes gene_type:complete